MESQTKRLRIGVVGAGAISRLGARDIATHGGADIVAIAETHAARRQEFAANFKVPKTYSDADSLFADADIDAVYIAVPNLHHAPLARAALLAGKHTLLDKPFAMNLTAAQSVAEAQRTSGRVFMLGMNQRFVRSSQRLKHLVSEGALGEIYHIKAFWRRRSGIPRIGSWFGNKAISGGGALLDIGVHLLDLGLYLADNFKPTAVSGATYTKFGNRGLGDGQWGISEREHGVFDADDFSSAFIRLSGGSSMALDATWAAHQESREEMDVVLYGTEAGAAAYGEKLFRFGVGGEYQVLQTPASKVALPHCNRFHHFINVVLGREAPVVAIEQALAVQGILDGIYESSRTGFEVRL